MLDQDKSVFIEYCMNCNIHSWCTNHEEAKYSHFFGLGIPFLELFYIISLVKEGIENKFEGFVVHGNKNPSSNFLGITRRINLSIAGKKMNPTLGAFEIVFRGYV